jgi:putative tryptophan/tyrosine transport system substrate-binding protein
VLRMLRLIGWVLISADAARAGQSTFDAAVLFRSGSDVYDQAVAGIREALARAPYRIDYIDLARNQPDFAAGQPRLVTTVGIGAWEQFKSKAFAAQSLPALVLRQDLKTEPARPGGAVFLDVPLVTVAENLRHVFPGRSRLGLIHRPAWPPPEPATLAKLKQLGFELRLVECSGPEKLLAAFASLKGEVDFVITEPDSGLYNSATVKPLVLASLEQRLPIIGFSAAFVRAGTLAGIYPDFYELGRQTGEMMIRILDGKSPRGDEEVRKVVVAVNQRISRLIGVEPVKWMGTVILK